MTCIQTWEAKTWHVDHYYTPPNKHGRHSPPRTTEWLTQKHLTAWWGKLHCWSLSVRLIRQFVGGLLGRPFATSRGWSCRDASPSFRNGQWASACNSELLIIRWHWFVVWLTSNFKTNTGKNSLFIFKTESGGAFDFDIYSTIAVCNAHQAEKLNYLAGKVYVSPRTSQGLQVYAGCFHHFS